MESTLPQIGYREAIRSRLTTSQFYAEGTLLWTAVTATITSYFFAAVAGKLPVPHSVKALASKIDFQNINFYLIGAAIGTFSGTLVGIGGGVQALLQTGWSSDEKRAGNVKCWFTVAQLFMPKSHELKNYHPTSEIYLQAAKSMPFVFPEMLEDEPLFLKRIAHDLPKIGCHMAALLSCSLVLVGLDILTQKFHFPLFTCTFPVWAGFSITCVGSYNLSSTVTSLWPPLQRRARNPQESRSAQV